VASLDKAAGVAFKSEAAGKAFELSLTAAEMLRKAGRSGEAAERFQQAALSNARDPRAAQAHRTAIETFATTLDSDSPEQLDRYAKLLDQHLSVWTQSPAATEVRWERVELLARRGQWDALLATVRAISKEDPHYERSCELRVAAYAGVLADDRSAQRFDAAREELQPLIFVDPTAWPAEWSPLQRDAALVLARAAMDHRAEGLDYGKQLLRNSITGRPTPQPSWERRAAVTLAVAMLAGGEMAEADAWLRRVHKGKPAEREQLLLTTLNHLREQGGVCAEADRLLGNLGALEGEVRQDAQSAAALAAAGRTAQAKQLYEKLAAERPDDRGVQTAYAKLLGSSADSKDREAALGRWRLIESRSEAGSDGWFEARLERLRLLVATGKQENAKKLLALTRLLAPSLGGDERHGEFEQIAKQLEQTSQ
jgi:tetratricopeptide (TPR) repeat protein